MTKDKKQRAATTISRHLAGAAHQRIALDRLKPNPWNMNKMAPALRTKLVHGIKNLYAKTGRLPPIVVRSHPDEPGNYQIIDGFHRWDVVRTENIDTEIDAFVLDVDTKTAMILTETLNYLRGDADPDLQVNFFRTLVNEYQMPVTELAEFVPNTADEIKSLFDAYSINIIDVDAPIASDTSIDDDPAEDAFVEVKFSVSKAQMEVIEAELARIGSFLTGRNLRGRALEFMAVNSSQTDILNLTGEPPEEPVEDSKDARRRAKMKDLKAQLKKMSMKVRTS